MRLFPGLQIFAALATIFASPVLACTCGIPSIAQEIERADVIFSGSPVAALRSDYEEFPGFPYYQIEFEVAESWKGDGEPLVLTYGGGEAACGFNFYPDKEYLVYARFRDGIDYAITSICTRTRELDKADDDLIVLRSDWDSILQDEVVSGAMADFDDLVRPALFAPGAEIVGVAADLSQLGGPTSVLLEEVGNGVYRLERSFPVSVTNGVKTITVRIEEAMDERMYSFAVARSIAVLPASDLVIFADGLGARWDFDGDERIVVSLQDESLIYEGTSALGLEVENFYFSVGFTPDKPVDLTGYELLHFAFHPGSEASERRKPALNVFVNDNAIRLLGENEAGVHVELDESRWQVVDIPLGLFGERPIQSIRLLGNLQGKFYIDDVRLVRREMGRATAVQMERTQLSPIPILEQNYPNPFNARTTIGFSVPAGHRGSTRLKVYNVSGQLVHRLLDGALAPGAHRVAWDGRDEYGEAVATGIYFYRLEAGGETFVGRMVLAK